MQIESREDVERCFVHVDHKKRHAPEHKVERMLLAAGETSSGGILERLIGCGSSRDPAV